MNDAFRRFLSLPDRDRADVFEETSRRLDTPPAYVEKDFWVCLTLDLLYNGLPDGHPRLLFKGGTSLSKAFQLVPRFSEDIDIVVDRRDLGFSGGSDPTAIGLSRKARERAFARLKDACRSYVFSSLQAQLEAFNDGFGGGRVVRDDEHSDPTLLIKYPTRFPYPELSYVTPGVRIECGSRSALGPRRNCTVTPFITDELTEWSLAVENIAAISPTRTYWEKLLILHGWHCGFRDEGRLPKDQHRLSRHYYDAAMITATEPGAEALQDHELLDDVRRHNLMAFPQRWKRFDQAVPGKIRLLPQPDLMAVVERDYRAMQGMIMGDAPGFDWIIGQTRIAETRANQS